MGNQRTIAKEFSVKGVGLHTAAKVNMTFKPAAVDTGITFIRTDLPARPAIKVCYDNILPQSLSPRRTSVGVDNAHVQTIEHLMAALIGLGIDNLVIELDNNEVPGLDGSSLNYAESLLKAEVVEQDKPKHYFLIKEPLYVEEDGAQIIALPAADLKISYTMSFNHPLLKASYLELQITPETFKEELSMARTFCLEKEATELQHQGLGRGANYENTLVVGEHGVIRNKLRYPDEFIRHKMLDLLGDLFVLGQPIKGHIIAIKSGHSLNLKMVRKILQHKEKYYMGALSINYNSKQEGELDIRDIMNILPHREPFLFVDRIISLEKGKRATGLKNVTINDYFFKGHFPGRPVMPGVLIIEAMAQVGGVMMLASEEHRGKLAFFMAADNLKFRRTVVPGDQLIFEVEAGRIKAKTGQVHGRALVDGKVVAEADLMFALVED